MSREKISLDQFLVNFKIWIGEDSYLKYSSDAQICSIAISAMKEIAIDVGGTLKSVRLEVDRNTLSVNFPNDYLDYTKIGVLNPNNGTVQVLGVNSDMNISGDILTDIDGNALLDSDGIEITSDTEKPGAYGADLANFDRTFYNCNWIAGGSNQYGVTTGNNIHGYYRIDSDNQRILFSSNIADYIILEYIADESMKSVPMIPSKIERFVQRCVYYLLIEPKVSVPMNEKLRARKEYFNEKRLAKKRMRIRRLYEFIQAGRAGNKQAPKF